MVFLVISPRGLDDALRMAAAVPDSAVWCGADAISKEAFLSKKLPGVTRFGYSPDPSDSASIQGALDTIEQHHPGETIWIEGAP